MKLKDINKIIINKTSNQELVRLHHRIHQLYSVHKKNIYKSLKAKELIKLLKEKHKIIVDEMNKRKLKHNSLLENYLYKINGD